MAGDSPWHAASYDEVRALIGLLGFAEPAVAARLEEHLAEYDELLATVLLSDIAKEAFAELADDRLARCVNWLLIVSSAPVRNLLLTGFVEGVPLDVDEARVLGLPNPLRNEIERDMGWPLT